jgi:chromosome segregation ATPase
LLFAAGQLQSTAQQLKEELSSTFAPLHSQLQSAADTLAAHDTALEGAASVAAAVKLLTGLPAAVADVSARLDELAQAQRAAEGELCANKEHCLTLDQQVAAAQAQLQVLEASLAAQQKQGGSAVQQLRREMMETVVEVRGWTRCQSGRKPVWMARWATSIHACIAKHCAAVLENIS